ncbi:hypothetical protein AXF42_Ash005065 [Apostasia shenzhenica]|uniref:Uncharacterized protein n=1 Tax=Apostasia shenzhenica TaxID=1088818 RepID=A0A2I0B8D2_9ASPA|nr:hypothetical protein AXF42_Ash005065 [Apostasia shenzhenica]
MTLVQTALPITSGTMFLSYTYHCQRALAAPFSKQHASFSHVNQGSACPNCHGSPEAVPILKASILLLRLLVPPTADKWRGLRACSPPFLRKIRTKLCNPSPINTSEQSSIKRIQHRHQAPRINRSEGRTRPRKSRIPPLSPLVKQELENKKSSLSPSFSLFLL